MLVQRCVFDNGAYAGTLSFAFSLNDVSIIENITSIATDIVPSINVEQSVVVNIHFCTMTTDIKAIVAIMSIEQFNGVVSFIDAKDEMLFTKIDSQLSAENNQHAQQVAQPEVPQDVQHFAKALVDTVSDIKSQEGNDDKVPIAIKIDTSKKPS